MFNGYRIAAGPEKVTSREIEFGLSRDGLCGQPTGSDRINRSVDALFGLLGAIGDQSKVGTKIEYRIAVFPDQGVSPSHYRGFIRPVNLSWPLLWTGLVILTPFFNAARGSLLVAVLFHFQMMNPVFPDAQPWDMLIFAAVAILIAVVNRRAMLERGSSVTASLMPGARW